MGKYGWVLLIALIHSNCSAYEWLYPVGAVTIESSLKIYVIYQKSVDHLELWLWDPLTKIATKGLLSSYIPAALKILPDASGFSFIDSGRVRIKYFSKRSPKTVDIYEPIYDIGPLAWLDEHRGYLAAKRTELFELFQMCTHGYIYALTQQAASDCMYPQIIDNQLLYIKRTRTEESFTYCIIQSHYTPVICPHEIPEEQQIDYVRSGRDITYVRSVEHTIIDCADKSIAFLKMIDATQGFCIQHPPVIDKHDPLLSCTYHRIYKKETTWQMEQIFTFNIPTYLLFDSQIRLYESMLPLVPQYHNNAIYYVHTESIHEPLNVYSFDCASGTSNQITFANNVDQSSIALLFTPGLLYHGGVVLHDKQQHQHPLMWIQDTDVCFELPFIDI